MLHSRLTSMFETRSTESALRNSLTFESLFSLVWFSIKSKLSPRLVTPVPCWRIFDVEAVDSARNTAFPSPGPSRVAGRGPCGRYRWPVLIRWKFLKLKTVCGKNERPQPGRSRWRIGRRGIIFSCLVFPFVRSGLWRRPVPW